MQYRQTTNKTNTEWVRQQGSRALAAALKTGKIYWNTTRTSQQGILKNQLNWRNI